LALINEKDAKAVREKLARLSNPVTLAVFTQEFEYEYCRQTRELVEEVSELSAGRITVELYDLVKDKAKADAMGIEKIPAVAVLSGKGEDDGIRFS
jgi:hypothetical protein